MADSWEGVLILLAVTAITLVADYARRRMPPPSDAVTYVPPKYPEYDEYVPPPGAANNPLPPLRVDAEDDEATEFPKPRPPMDEDRL